jgi:hypothetical protein
MYRRNLTDAIVAALSDTPAVFLQGPRQAGKSTLAQEIANSDHRARYLSLDDAAVISAAKADPQGFVSGLSGPVVLDEVQRVPELFLAIKREIDRDREPGRFLLTGSADVLLLPKISESLAGRLEIFTLWPFSQGELSRHTEGFIDTMFGASLPQSVRSQQDRTGIVNRVLTGGYPEVVGRIDIRRQRAWFGSYITTILQRDIRDLASIEGLTDLPRLLSTLAAETSRILNFSDLSRNMSMPQSTLKRYLTLLEATFLVQTVPAWLRNLGKRLAKSAKIMLSDSGLASHLTGIDQTRVDQPLPVSAPPIWGQILETFVAMEVRKQIGWSKTRPRLFLYRTHKQREVDVVLEDRSGHVVGIEVKSSASLKADASAGIKDLAECCGDSFVRGVVLYLGDEVVPFSRRIHAVPLPALWCW